MLTTTAPPILIWQPGGGTPIGPVSNPPVYSQSDITQLVIGQAYVDVVFGSVQTDNNWVLVTCEVENTIDLDPLNIWPGIITSRTPAGFRVYLNGLPDTGNYYLHWAVSGVNITPVPASTYLFTGPTSAPFGVNESFTVKLPPSTTLAAPITITPNDGGAGGTFSPPTVTLSNGSATATFVYNAVAYGAATISVTNSGTLTDPASIVFTSIAPTYTFTGPSGGVNGVASTNFTVNIGGQTLAIPATITPHDGGAGGTFTPTTVVLTTGSAPQHFTYTPVSVGAKTISVTNSGGLSDPAAIVYTVTTPPLVQHLLNTLISYWKLDESSGGGSPIPRADSQGTNNLDDTPQCASATGLIGNGVSMVAANSDSLIHLNNASLQVTSDFTFSVWVKLTAQHPNVCVLSKGNNVTSDYSLMYAGGGGGFYCSVSNSSSQAVSGPDVANGAWTHLLFWYDSGTSKVSIRINDTTTSVAPSGAALVQNATNFSIGAFPSIGLNIDAVIDEVGFWKRLLTADEKTFLYNGGAGNPFSSFIA